MKANSRDALLHAGLDTIFKSGYHGASVRDIVATADVAQGSFTNHFRSKERFAGEVLELYFEEVKAIMDRTLNDTSLSPRARLLDYLDVITARLATDAYFRGCLIGDLSAEISTQSEPLRMLLETIYREWVDRFAVCIAEAQACDEISKDFQARDLAEFLIASWEGAILRMKVEQNPKALERFKQIAFQTIFKK